MSVVAKYLAAGVVALGIATPAAAENWTRFSATDQTIYVVDIDTLTPADGVATAQMARVPAHSATGDLSHETEVVLVRCSDGQSKSGETVSFGPDGAETDRYTDDGPWSASGGVYESIKNLACDNTRPAGTGFPTIAEFIASGRGQ